MLIEILLTLIIITVLVLSYLERKDLNNRLMARSLKELREHTDKDEKNDIEPEDDDTIPLEDAQDLIQEEMNG